MSNESQCHLHLATAAEWSRRDFQVNVTDRAGPHNLYTSGTTDRQPVPVTCRPTYSRLAPCRTHSLALPA
jgi:hypothetical protein